MENNNNIKNEKGLNRKFIFIGLILLVLIIAFGITVSYFRSDFTSRHEITGTGTAFTYDDTFVAPSDWQPGQTLTNLNFKVTNTSPNTNKVAVRASITETWKDSNNNTLANQISSTDVAIKTLGTDWEKIGNYYYYKVQLDQGDQTGTLFSSLQLNPAATASVNCTENNGERVCTGNGQYSNATYTMVIHYELIEASQVNDEWGTNPFTS